MRNPAAWFVKTVSRDTLFVVRDSTGRYVSYPAVIWEMTTDQIQTNPAAPRCWLINAYIR